MITATQNGYVTQYTQSNPEINEAPFKLVSLAGDIFFKCLGFLELGEMARDKRVSRFFTFHVNKDSKYARAMFQCHLLYESRRCVLRTSSLPSSQGDSSFLEIGQVQLEIGQVQLEIGRKQHYFSKITKITGRAIHNKYKASLLLRDVALKELRDGDLGAAKQTAELILDEVVKSSVWYEIVQEEVKVNQPGSIEMTSEISNSYFYGKAKKIVNIGPGPHVRQWVDYDQRQNDIFCEFLLKLLGEKLPHNMEAAEELAEAINWSVDHYARAIQSIVMQEALSNPDKAWERAKDSEISPFVRDAIYCEIIKIELRRNLEKAKSKDDRITCLEKAKSRAEQIREESNDAREDAFSFIAIKEARYDISAATRTMDAKINKETKKYRETVGGIAGERAKTDLQAACWIIFTKLEKEFWDEAFFAAVVQLVDAKDIEKAKRMALQIKRIEVYERALFEIVQKEVDIDLPGAGETANNIKKNCALQAEALTTVVQKEAYTNLRGAEKRARQIKERYRSKALLCISNVVGETKPKADSIPLKG